MSLSNFLFSFRTTLILLAILAIGAGCATFIENDFGTSSARVLVYNNLWYEVILVLTTVNLTGIIFKYKMWKNKARFIFHAAFVIILIGAGITRYVGYEGIMEIPEGETQNKIFSLEPYLQVIIKDADNTYYQEYQKEFTSLFPEINKFSHKINFNDKFIDINYKDYKFVKKNSGKMGLTTLEVVYNGEIQEVKLPGMRGQNPVPRDLQFGNLTVTLAYGSKIVDLPFSIKLNDFQLDRYPGSMAPSSYASEVTVIKENGKTYDYRIFMNRTMNEGNFLFFQSSYFPDESGTILSVNNDPGKWPTYFGYFLLTLGLLLNFFDKKSRFWKLTKYVSSRNLASITIVSLLLFSANSVFAQEVNSEELSQNKQILDYLNKFKTDSKSTAEEFSKLVTQSSNGRMKPLSTLNLEIIQKLSGKSTLLDMNADQLVLGMITRPDIWSELKVIKIKTPKLKKFLGIDENEKYIAFSEVFKDGKYLLSGEAEAALQVKPMDRGTYEKDIIQLDERLNIIYSVFNGTLFNIFPKIKDSVEDDKNKWYNPLDAMQIFKGQNQVAVETMTREFINYVVESNWEEANKFLSMIKIYQQKVGSEIIPSQTKIDNEILFNKINIFFKVTLAYLILGFIMLVVAFFVVFNPKIQPKKTTTLFFIILALLFATHTFGMGFRWVISGHAPWSDTYESLLYISWSAVFAGVVFFRKSLLALSASVIVASIFMFTAHLTGINPQITNLIPVLKSY